MALLRVVTKYAEGIDKDSEAFVWWNEVETAVDQKKAQAGRWV